MKIKMVDPSKITIAPENDPPRDNYFIELYKKVIMSQIPTHRVLIKKEGIVPFSDFKPKSLEDPNSIIRQVIAEKNYTWLHVYPKKGKYVMSDDYNAYWIYTELGFKVFPCFVMGAIDGPESKYIFATNVKKLDLDYFD